MTNQCDWKTKISAFFMAIGICLANLVGKALGILVISSYLHDIFSPEWVTLSPERQLLNIIFLVFFIWNYSMFDWKLGDKMLKKWMKDVKPPVVINWLSSDETKKVTYNCPSIEEAIYILKEMKKRG